jgi:hypothetical protein
MYNNNLKTSSLGKQLDYYFCRIILYIYYIYYIYIIYIMSNSTIGYAPKGYDPSQREPESFHTIESLRRALNKFYGETRYSPRSQTVLYRDDPPPRKTGVHTRDSLRKSRVPIGGRRQSRRQLRRPKTPKRKTRRH